MKIKKCTYPNCEECRNADCVNENLSPEERKRQDDFDRKIIAGRKYGRKLVVWNYQHSEKGKEAQKRYNCSQKGKQRKIRYLKTEKGKIITKEKKKREILNGKNAENCKRYYQKKKMQKSLIKNL